MTGSGFTGVKQPEFDTMAGKHTQAAGRLEQLAEALYGELQSAGVDTSPALRLRELAGRVGKQADDLRRRQALIREMEQQKVSFGTSTTAGSFMEMPDGLDAAQGLLDGTVAARAALLAVGGDAKALAALQKYAKRGNDPEFVRTFLRKLGAKGVTELPGSLAAQLRDGLNHGKSARVDQISTQSKQALRMLSAALAGGTDPKNKAYMGDDFLKQLVAQGRAEHTVGDVKYAGYQAQALIWGAHDGKPPFSGKFMETVGSDAVAYEKEQYKDRWAASKDALGQAVGGRQVPLFDLAAALGLGSLMKPGAAAGSGKRVKAAVVEDLLHAAGSGKEASQALLNHTPAGWKQSVLDHMLTTRLGAFDYTDNYGSFSKVLLAGATGQDATSKKLAAELTKSLADQARGAFGKAGDGNLEITNRAVLDRLAPLRYPLARAMAANIDQVSNLLLNHGMFGKVDATAMSYALALATRDDAGFEALIRAQTEHMKAALDSVPPVGLEKSNLKALGFTEADLKTFDFDEDGRIGKTDVAQFLVDNIVGEARPFGHLVEIRRQVMIAEGLDDKKVSEALQTMVRDTIGLIPVPGARQVGELATGAFGSLLTTQYDKATGAGYDAAAKWAAGQVSEKGLNLGETYQRLANDRLAVEKLAEQMIATAMLKKGMLDDASLKHQTFTVGAPPTIKPFTEMSPAEYSEFLGWVNEKGGSADLLDRFAGTFRRTSDVDDYLNLRIPSSQEGSK
ncbi:hypothetical protein [Streptosporangium minutum]|uniref:EF-hand domain-containing protein n=1 Tax=Streptosporangium minutum TaxID=569862 RepID=A0A243RA96_9ACTN|nr:hypothetical protein [Streptosporangium minutum]OUC91530.1 hypothetical protein CA984_33385 [Streptosporangium minutum]